MTTRLHDHITDRDLAALRAWLEEQGALDPLHQGELLDALTHVDADALFAGLDADDRARLIDEMPAKVARRLLDGLSDEARTNTNRLLGYPEESARRMMSPRFVSLRASMSASDALAKVRRAQLRPREVLVVPVTDDQRRLVGAVDLPDLVTAAPATSVSELLQAERYQVRVDEDQEVAARLMQEADLVALPYLEATASCCSRASARCGCCCSGWPPWRR